MKKQLFTFIILTIWIFKVFSQAELEQSSLVFYKKGIGVNISMILTLSNDFTFIEYTEAMSCVDRSSATNTISGTFKIDKNKLLLNPKELISYDYQGNFKKYTETKVILKNCFFTSSYDIVKNKDLILLLYDSTGSNNYTNDFIDIANAINKTDSETTLYYIWKNSNNTEIKIGKEIASSFPETWKNYILTKPIEGKVINAKIVSKVDKAKYPFLDSDSKYIYTLDVGEDAGIRKGMKLYAKGKNDSSCELIILLTEKKQSIGFIRQWQEEGCGKLKIFCTKDEN